MCQNEDFFFEGMYNEPIAIGIVDELYVHIYAMFCIVQGLRSSILEDSRLGRPLTQMVLLETCIPMLGSLGKPPKEDEQR